MSGVERMKRCARCGVLKPWSMFSAKARWEDGSMRRPQSQCKACHAERSRARYAADRDAKRELNRLAWRKRADDLAWRRAERERVKLASRAYRARHGAVSRIVEPDVWLPVAPFRGWLLEELESMTAAVLAERLGVSDRRLYAWLHETQTVALTSVDECAIRAGQPWLLDELYPPVDEEQEAA